jgi:hypothetical protein
LRAAADSYEIDHPTGRGKRLFALWNSAGLFSDHTFRPRGIKLGQLEEGVLRGV